MTTGRLDRRITLHNMIDEFFNVDEMRDLYHQCGLNYDDEVGDKSSRIWRLIDYYSKRENILAEKCSQFPGKQGHNWPFLMPKQ